VVEQLEQAVVVLGLLAQQLLTAVLAFRHRLQVRRLQELAAVAAVMASAVVVVVVTAATQEQTEIQILVRVVAAETRQAMAALVVQVLCS
jgi:hypothetical protein